MSVKERKYAVENEEEQRADSSDSSSNSISTSSNKMLDGRWDGTIVPF